LHTFLTFFSFLISFLFSSVFLIIRTFHISLPQKASADISLFPGWGGGMRSFFQEKYYIWQSGNEVKMMHEE
jgi:hypothetical protein